MDSIVKPQTIIQDIGAYEDYPFEAISGNALASLNEAGTRIAKCHHPRISALIKYLECFLQVSGQLITLIKIRSSSFQSICEQFVGALYSDEFTSLSINARYTYCSTFKALLAEFPQVSTDQFSLSTLGVLPSIEACKEKYALLQRQEDQVWLWRNWPSTNRTGRTSYFPLYPIYKRLGRDFTQRLFETCDQYFSGRKANPIVALKELAAFIGDYPRELSPSEFRSPTFITKFWREFLIYYFTTRYSTHSDIHTITRDWRNEFIWFVEQYLEGNRFVRPPFWRISQSANKVSS